MLDNLPWHALNTVHARFALSAPAARKYPTEVTPFCGTADNSAESLAQLRELLKPGETAYLMGEAPPGVAGLIAGDGIGVLQMLGPERLPEAGGPSIIPLTREDAPAMVELTTLAFPGFFRPRTCEMGAYYGIRIGGELVAMAGERMALPDAREISGVCTRPGHTGHGFAAQLIAHLLQEHAAAGLLSFLHVNKRNARAIALYQRLGFSVRREFVLHPLFREAARPHFGSSV